MSKSLKLRLLTCVDNENEFYVNVKGFHSKVIIGDFIQIVRWARKQNIKSISLDFAEYSKRTYPNIILPIAGIISYYTETEGIEFKFLNITHKLLKDTGFPKSFNVANDLNLLELDIFNKIIEFKSTEDVNYIIECIFNQLKNMFAFPPGVLKGANWGISEVMDNVINHAVSNKSYVMIQIHQKINSLIFTVYDNGQGIFNSLKGSPLYETLVTDDKVAIKLALEKGITRNSKIGAGYGLWGLSRIVSENKGSMGLTSGKSNVLITSINTTETNQSLMINEEVRSTMVELQIKYDEYIDMRKIFGDYETYDNVVVKVEQMEDEHSIFLVFKLDEQKLLRTRTDGEQVRNQIINAHNVSGKPVKIDFSNVNDKITSSFIDESIAKLYCMYSIDDFQKKYRIIGADEFTLVIIKKTLEDRIKNSYAKVLTSL